MDPAQALEEFARGTLRPLDDFFDPLLVAAQAQVAGFELVAQPIPEPIQELVNSLMALAANDGQPGFEPGHAGRALLLSEQTPGAKLYLREPFSGITLDRLIIFRDNVLEQLYAPNPPSLADVLCGRASEDFTDAIAALMHELVHVRQWDVLGRETFISNYLLETLRNGGHYGSDVPFEHEGFQLEDYVDDHLPTSGSQDLLECRSQPWAEWWMSSDTQVLAGDFDGDGKTDVMKFDNGKDAGVWVGLARGQSFQTSEWGRWDMTPDTHVLAGDFDGDGRTDVMKLDNGNPGGLWVGLARDGNRDGSNDHFETRRWADWQVTADLNVLAGDFDGDGKTDVLKFDNGAGAGVWVGLSRDADRDGKNDTFQTSRWARWDMGPDTHVQAGDFDGDGKTDVMKFDNGTPAGVWVGLSRDTDGRGGNDGFVSSGRWADWWMSPDTQVQAGDFDGDGKTDVMKFDNGTPAGVWVGLSRDTTAANAGGHFATGRWADWWMTPDTQVLAGDFDGDGKTDVMKFDNGSSSGVWRGLSRDANRDGLAESFAGDRWGLTSMAPASNVLAGDFDGDGKTDVVKFDNGKPGALWVLTGR